MFPKDKLPLFPSIDGDALRNAHAENKRLKDAGNKLAQAAVYTATEYDGCHRLLQAVSEWYVALATEGGRPRD